MATCTEYQWGGSGGCGNCEYCLYFGSPGCISCDTCQFKCESNQFLSDYMGYKITEYPEFDTEEYIYINAQPWDELVSYINSACKKIIDNLPASSSNLEKYKDIELSKINTNDIITLQKYNNIADAALFHQETNSTLDYKKEPYSRIEKNDFKVLRNYLNEIAEIPPDIPK